MVKMIVQLAICVLWLPSALVGFVVAAVQMGYAVGQSAYHKVVCHL